MNWSTFYSCWMIWINSLIFLLHIIGVVPDIGMMVRAFANGPRDLGSIPGRVIPKTQKRYLMPPCLTFSFIRYWSRIKWSSLGNEVAPFPTPWCCSYWKGAFGSPSTTVTNFTYNWSSLSLYWLWHKINYQVMTRYKTFQYTKQSTI